MVEKMAVARQGVVLRFGLVYGGGDGGVFLEASRRWSPRRAPSR